MPLFDPMGWLTLGERLAKSSTEAELRTAISRVYYACHIIARDRMFGDDASGLRRKDREILAGRRKTSEHQVVSEAIAQNTGIKKGAAKRLSDQLGELRSMREQADYFRNSERDEIKQLFSRYRVGGWPGLANTAVARARSLVPELGALGTYKRP